MGSGTERTTASLLAAFGVFQVALAAGAPWGRAAYGGTRGGTLPRHLRVISGIAAVGYVGATIAVLRGVGSGQTRRRCFTALSAFMALGTVVNGASRSTLERAIWTPLTASTSVVAWRSRRRSR